MCGIAGLLISGASSELQVCGTTLQMMSDRLIHRGPDASGLWCADDGRVGLVHRRLSILDLSDAGAQPMFSHCGRFVSVFNGEIYNHLELRAELEEVRGAIDWRGHSDTETLLEGISHWGLHETLTRAFGMFALAVWDAKEHTLSLARDRMGEKPLYASYAGEQWGFASEFISLCAVPELADDLNFDALASQVATGVIPDEHSVFANVRKVQPGSIMTIAAVSGEMSERFYETFPDLVRQGYETRSATPQASHAAADQIEGVLSEVITSQMISDVPLGSFLSGGVDSSLVTALMQVNSARAVKTFSIGFADVGYDESAHAEKVAEHLGTDHQTFNLYEDDALEIIPELGKIYGEPFADSSQIPTLLLCREARRHVTVALTGDGGDEIFGGYNRHVLAPRLWTGVSEMPFLAKKGSGLVGKLISSQSDWLIEKAAKLARLSPSVLRKAARFGEIVGSSSSLEDVYFGLTRHCDDPEKFLRQSGVLTVPTRLLAIEHLDPAERLMAFDSVGYLPSDILVKVDRAAMSASLETRAPFMDARTVRAAWSLSLPNRIRNGVGKAVLRDILYRYVPKEMIERPKHGFAIPIDAWLRGPLRAWADNLISIGMINEFAILRPEPVRDLWDEHLSGSSNHGHLLWSLLMLQQWLQQRKVSCI